MQPLSQPGLFDGGVTNLFGGQEGDQQKWAEADGKEVTVALVCQTFTEQTCSSSKETQRKRVSSSPSEPSKRWGQWESVFKKTFYSELFIWSVGMVSDAVTVF